MTSAESGFFGRLNWDAFPIAGLIQDPNTNEIVANAAAGVVIVGVVLVLGLLTWFRLWGPLWRDWLTSADHKKIGIMYIVFAIVMLARGVLEGVVMRAQQAAGPGEGFLEAEHFAELFSTHGTIMIFFVAVPFVFGLANFLVPLMIGARDVAFPVMNQISLGLTVSAGMMLMVSLVVGEFSTGGWTAYPPYTGAAFNPGVGPDYWIWAIVVSGIGTTLTGINFAVTIYKLRAPGMKFMRLPMYCWTIICSSILIVFAMPPLGVAALLLAADRYLDFHFFTNDLGGNMMNYANLFWLFGHPEVYLLVLPAYGIYSEVFATFSAKRLYGYTSLVIATMSIAVLSFTVWLHHFFTMGQSALINAVFGIATMLIAIPTGVKVYDWMATLYRGRIRFSVPMLYGLAFLLLFVIGGLSGVILANPTVDYQVHNTLFLVAHFHNVLLPGVLFGLLAGYNYWFPKAFGFRLDEVWGRISVVLWTVGFMLTFLPLYFVGLMGMPRRSYSWEDPSFHPYMITAVIGALVILAALLSVVVQLWVSIRNREQSRVPVGDPWDARTLEWSIPAPPPPYNFAIIPHVTDRDDFAAAKERGAAYPHPDRYEDITMPRNTSIGFVLCVLSGVWMFALVWWIWWLAALMTVMMILSFILWTFRTDTEEVVSAEDVRRQHEAWLDLVRTTPPVTRDHEGAPENAGLARPDLEATT
ncbi:cytochrome o ubiquinol oxidase subunit 1 [Ruegeria intermedia]|uniref:Cytochrome o ubiquinol oxidase subunit 1 n=1 Tax=Ruegeria intermedia TaxID=996115 RepID=A0A1M4VUL7_9RHOB|nr:cbb3-type cytochrome c oxidase subunit I [Ruegeria intermedia]SHE72590.1 cytochrome o ubiquinol oxidase subunit 1 [Ruegeria intermedia]